FRLVTNQAGDAAVFSGLQEGALVLADISGYSKFIAQTEVEHSWSILHELLDTMVRSVQGRMDVSQVEGDAILFISGLSTAEVIVNAPLEVVFKRMREPNVMQRYLFSDGVEVIEGARGEDLGSEFHCHHGGTTITMRVVSVEHEKELTLITDNPPQGYITTRL